MSVLCFSPRNYGSNSLHSQFMWLFLDEIDHPSLTYISYLHQFYGWTYLKNIYNLFQSEFVCFEEGLHISHRPKWPTPVIYLSCLETIFYSLLIKTFHFASQRQTCWMIQLKPSFFQVRSSALRACGKQFCIVPDWLLECLHVCLIFFPRTKNASKWSRSPVAIRMPPSSKKRKLKKIIRNFFQAYIGHSKCVMFWTLFSISVASGILVFSPSLL